MSKEEAEDLDLTPVVQLFFASVEEREKGMHCCT